MGYRKDIKRYTRELRELVSKLHAAQRGEEWARVAHLADQINALAWDIRNAARSVQLSDW